MEIASFKYKEKEYVITYINNKIKYGYKENGKLNTKLTTEEDNMMKYVISKIFISNSSKNHYKSGKTMHNGKIFQVMYDEISEKKFFYEIVNNEYKNPGIEDNIYLHEKFNFPLNNDEQKEKGEYKKDISKKTPTFKQKLKVYGIYFTIHISALATFIIATSKYNPGLFRLAEYEIINAIDNQIEVEDLEKSLQKNTSLSEEEKEEFRKFYEMVNENKEYINPYNIKIIEKYKINYTGKTRKGIAGTNDKIDNCINIYGEKDSYEETIKDDWYKKVLSHEVCHTFGFTTDGLTEAINEELSAEYVTKTPSSYYDERMCLYSLCEIVNPDCFKSYFFAGDKKPLINELTSLINDKDKAYELIGNIDCIKENRREILNNENEARKQEIEELQRQLKEEIYDTISDYFSAKYSYPMEEDNVMMAYLCNSGFLREKNIYEKNRDEREGYMTTNVFSKGYFSESYKQENQTILLEQTDMKDKDHLKHGLKVKDIDREKFLTEYQGANGIKIR